MNTPLIRTLEQVEALEREQQANERRHLIALGVRRGWISFPSAESDAPRRNKKPAQSELHGQGNAGRLVSLLPQVVKRRPAQAVRRM